jgi:hypothetical protein
MLAINFSAFILVDPGLGKSPIPSSLVQRGNPQPWATSFQVSRVMLQVSSFVSLISLKASRGHAQRSPRLDQEIVHHLARF